MATFRQNNGRIIFWLRWPPRLIGLGLALLVLFTTIRDYLVGEPLPTRVDMTLPAVLMFIGMLTMIVGAVLAWRWEGFGGILVLGGALLFGLVNSLNHATLRIGIIEPTFAVVGILFLACWWHTRREQ